MRPLPLSRPFIAMLMLLLAVQLACGVGSGLPTNILPTSAAATEEATEAAAPQNTPAAPAEATQTTPPTSTGEHGTPAEAEAMLNAAVKHYQSAGREQALKDFTDKKAPFSDRDLYVVCLGQDHKMTANGGYPLLVGLSADALNDSNGKPLGQAVWDVVAVQPQGSMPFHWKNPLTGQEESKVLFYQKLDQDVCGVAANQ